MLTTSRELSKLLGSAADTIKKWITRLEEQGIITKKKEGKQVRLTLTEVHMRIAQAPDSIVHTVESAPHALSPEVQSLIQIAEGASELKRLDGNRSVTVVL